MSWQVEHVSTSRRFVRRLKPQLKVIIENSRDVDTYLDEYRLVESAYVDIFSNNLANAASAASEFSGSQYRFC